VVGWEVCYGVGWKDGEVIGRRVLWCEWLSAKPAARPRQNKSQPEQEFLENGENPENLPEQEILENGEKSEIRRIRKNTQNPREKWRKWISLTGSPCWPSASANHRQTG